MRRDDSLSPLPLTGQEARLWTPDGKVMAIVHGPTKEEIEHHAQRVAANDAVILAVIPMLRAVRNGISKRVFASLDFPVAEGDEDWVNIAHGEGASSLLLRKKVAEYIRRRVMNAVNIEDVDLVAMLPTVEITEAP